LYTWLHSDGNCCANFGENRFGGGFSLSRWNITHLWLFDCFVLSFLLSRAPRSNRGTDCHASWLKRRVSAQGSECFLGATTIHDVIWENMPQKPTKSGRQAKMPKYENGSICKIVKPKFEDKAESTTYTSWVGTITLNQIQHGWRPPSWKSV